MVNIITGFRDSAGEFLKAFRVHTSDKVHVFVVREDGTCIGDVMGKLAEGGRYLVLPTMERLFIDPTIYRDPHITKRDYAFVYEKNIRPIDFSEFGRTREALKMSHEAYKIYVAKLMEFLTPGSNILAILFLILGFLSGFVVGLMVYWAIL